jgi:hypothetical protein
MKSYSQSTRQNARELKSIRYIVITYNRTQEKCAILNNLPLPIEGPPVLKSLLPEIVGPSEAKIVKKRCTWVGGFFHKSHFFIKKIFSKGSLKI